MVNEQQYKYAFKFITDSRHGRLAANPKTDKEIVPPVVALWCRFPLPVEALAVAGRIIPSLLELRVVVPHRAGPQKHAQHTSCHAYMLNSGVVVVRLCIIAVAVSASCSIIATRIRRSLACIPSPLPSPPHPPPLGAHEPQP